MSTNSNVITHFDMHLQHEGPRSLMWNLGPSNLAVFLQPHQIRDDILEQSWKSATEVLVSADCPPCDIETGMVRAAGLFLQLVPCQFHTVKQARNQGVFGCKKAGEFHLGDPVL